jgi:hypothetical protein
LNAAILDDDGMVQHNGFPRCFDQPGQAGIQKDLTLMKKSCCHTDQKTTRNFAHSSVWFFHLFDHLGDGLGHNGIWGRCHVLTLCSNFILG